MASFNKAILIGNLVADPELKQTPNGIPVTSFRIAVARRFAKPGDEQQADFFDIVAWRQTAEFVTRYFSKGTPILVCGSIQTRSFTDTNGNKKYVTEVVADEASFVEKKAQTAVASPASGEAPSYSQSSGQYEDLSTDDELPF